MPHVDLMRSIATLAAAIQSQMKGDITHALEGVMLLLPPMPCVPLQVNGDPLLIVYRMANEVENGRLSEARALLEALVPLLIAGVTPPRDQEDMARPRLPRASEANVCPSCRFPRSGCACRSGTACRQCGMPGVYCRCVESLPARPGIYPVPRKWTCNTCGMQTEAGQPLSYSCPRQDCPSFIRATL